ncbi:hypothetical protein C7N43_35070 [Sphingobacteriales bacterium UPWRP_1]|nr:hypothetical protein C7N43_35070 [Sphingobacteriales bacterium UPWRP_1]
MKRGILVFVLLLASLSATFGQNVSVRGYVRSNGTYVQPHHRTAPNYTNRDNYTTRPNVNPYTGTRGYKTPDTKFYTPQPRSRSTYRNSYYRW